MVVLHPKRMPNYLGIPPVIGPSLRLAIWRACIRLAWSREINLVIRAPIRVEADGSFRMNAPVRDGVDAYLLVGSRVSCENAAQQAAQQALQQLDGSKPVFALILVDIAWEMLLKSHPGLRSPQFRIFLEKMFRLRGDTHWGRSSPVKNRPHRNY